MGMTYQEAVERYGWLVERIAARRARPHVDADDLEQEGYIGLLKAVRTWRPDGGASFKSWASLLIDRYVRLCVAREPETVPYDEDVFASKAGQQETTVFLHELSRRLTPAEVSLLQEIVMGRTTDEIAADLGVTNSTVSRRAAAARKRVSRAA